MDLLTEEIRRELIENGTQTDEDHIPVLKLFDPCGSATWLLTELDEDGDRLFGLADMGFGFPELGSASLRELASIRTKPYGLGIERDEYFEARHPISVYARAARKARRIVETETELEEAAKQKEGRDRQTKNEEYARG